MSSRHKKYIHTNRHGHEKEPRVILEGEKARKPRLEVSEHRPAPKPTEAKSPANTVTGNLYSFNAARLAAERSAEFRSNP